MSEQKKHDQPQADDLAQQDARTKQTVDFDPKVHGVGTVPQTAPNSVAELYKMHKALADKFDGQETDASTYISGMLNSFESRIRQIEAKVFPQSVAPATPAAAPTDPASEQEAPAPSPFAKKKEHTQ
jgi:hypothetical protein